MTGDHDPRIGVVVIGRNEGDRLRRCLESVIGAERLVAYVDSGSTDNSVELARSLSAAVIELDQALPFTAARARNMGWRRLVEQHPDIRLVQFVDGDCEVVPEWWNHALQTMQSDPFIGICCGRRRERYPEASIYNRLCDLEWDTPVGNAEACGGDAMARLDALQAVDGYRDGMIAGEEPELCLRLRRHGMRIVRIDIDMTLHDAAITRFSQWWRRAVRAGHAYAEGAWLSRGERPGLWHKEQRSILFWGIALPAAALGAAWWTNGWSLLLLLGFLVLFVRVGWRASRRWPGCDARMYAAFCVIAKPAHAVGIWRYYSRKLLGRRSRLIEYKTTSSVVSHAS